MLETIAVSLLFAYESHNVQWYMNMKYNAYVKHVLRIEISEHFLVSRAY